MDMSSTFYPSPVAAARGDLSTDATATFMRLLGAVNTPNDQPNVTLVIRNLSMAFRFYGQTLTRLKDPFQQLIHDVQQLEDELNGLLKNDVTPSCQLSGRLLKFPAWRLALQLNGSHTQILIACGAEVARALLLSEQLDARYCKHLSRDLQFLSSADAQDPLDEDDLAQLGFGQKWMAHFERINRVVKQLVQHPNPDGAGPERPNGLSAAFSIQRRVMAAISFPVMKQRAAALNHRNVSPHQFFSIALELRTRVVDGCTTAACVALQILTSLTAELVLSLPLRRDPNQYWIGCLNVTDGVIELNFDCIFPSRRRPKPAARHLFEPSGSVTRSPLPSFMVDFLQAALRQHPAATCIGELLDWPLVDVRANLLPALPSRITPSVARAAQSLGVNAVAMGLPRTLAATMTWDFSLMPTARAYYARLTKEEISSTWADYLDELGWTVAQPTRDALLPFGSLCCLIDTAVTSIFLHLAQQVQTARPGRHAGLDRLIQHHNAYAVYLAALISFCCGLRERTVYQIRADDWGKDAPFAALNDKRSGKRKDDRPVVVCDTVRTALGQWRGHCAGLLARIDRLDSSSHLATLKDQLLSIAAFAEVPLLFSIKDHQPIPMGSSAVWDTLPAELAAPANCGRVYWLNVLSKAGFRSSDIDIFMRHSVPGLETNASTYAFAILPTLHRIGMLQDRKLATVLPRLQSGLRNA